MPVKDKSNETIKNNFFLAKYMLITPTLLCSQKMQVQNNCCMV